MAQSQQLIDRLRAAYVFRRRLKQPNYQPSPDLENVLDRAAENCIEAKLTPEDYMLALYRAYGSKFDNFWPNQLVGANALRVACDYAKNFQVITPDMLWQTQWQKLKRAIDYTDREVEDILFDQAMPFTPWFRIIAMVEANIKVIGQYGCQAKKDLTPALEQFLRSNAPQQLDRIISYERYLSST